jgi:serine/threonine protein kinase/Tol biopolymer transport system component
MALSTGARLGSYEILSAIGAGGMGEVYRARDTRLDRTVAIKILPAALAADPQMRDRFDREARAISSLSHPHICALFDVGQQDGVDFLVLEYLEGETLDARLARSGEGDKGGLPPADALRHAIEICDALDKAHRSGVIHRDLKPANVMLTKSGAKLLDFGLAKSAAPVVALTGLSMLPTTPPNLTAQGTILGTFQYMAPEQIEGLEADPRTDIFAFGALLFEMLTGRRAFDGKTRASLLGAILKDEPPPVSRLQPLAPKPLDRIVSTCLAKDPDDRYQSARDLLRDLKASSDAAETPVTAAPTPRPVSSRLAWAIAALAVLALSLVTVRHLRETPASADVIQFTIPPPENASFATPPGGGTGIATQVAVSPDGRNVVFVANVEKGFQLWIRPLGAAVAQAIPGTEDGTFPFWSPDNRYIGFFANGKLKKVSVAGGQPTVLCDAASGRGGTWNRDNVIVFAPSNLGVLHRVSGAGGVAQAASTLDNGYGEGSHRFPSFLPDGRHFVYSGTIGTCCPPSKAGRIRIGSLDTMDATTLLEADSSALVASGHLLFYRNGTLMARPFDATSRQFTGDSFPIVESIGYEGSRYASFSASDTGVLVSAYGLGQRTGRLTWMDRAGRELNTIGDPSTYRALALSSDDRRVAVVSTSGTPENRDIWIMDAQRGMQTRFTFDAGNDNAPVWSPDNLRIVFQGTREGSSALRQKSADGTLKEEVLLPVDAGTTPTDWSAGGRYIAYATPQVTLGSYDIWALPLFGDRKPFTLVETPFNERNAVFSPDDRWLAYQSNESGQTQIYVQPFPATGGKFQVSRNGGAQPVWRSDSKELFFISSDSRMMATETAGGRFDADPTPLFTVATIANDAAFGPQYAVAKDGQRFLVNVIQQQTRSTPLSVVVNWLASVQK